MQPNETEALHNLPKHAYLEYIKLFPITRSPEVRTYTTLILTLLAVIGFSMFAISPTLQTIIELRKTLADDRFANDSLEQKISSMQRLQEQYGALGSSLERISAAIPLSPDAPTLLAKIQTLAKESGMTVAQMETLEVELTKQGTNGENIRPSSFIFTVTVTGSYAELTQFLESLHSFDRIVTIDNLSITKEADSTGTLTALIKAKAYFHPEAPVQKGVPQ